MIDPRWSLRSVSGPLILTNRLASNNLVTSKIVGNGVVGKASMRRTALSKAGANWVEGDRFFDRDAELEALRERVQDRTHTLLTAQRRMGKTSLVRESLRRLKDEGSFETVFVDLEDAMTPADAIAEIGVQSRSAQGAWQRIGAAFANTLEAVLTRVDALSVADLRVKLRAGIDAGTWQQRGGQVLEALAGNDRPVVLAMDELPLLVNRLLKGDDYHVTPERRRDTDEFLSWLRKNGQTHRDRICMILTGSVSLEPILQQAGLSAHANIFSPFDLKPWDEKTAMECLGALAKTYSLHLSPDVRREMCRRLRCQIPHHVQQFFDKLHQYLRRTGRRRASLEDVERVYTDELLGVRGQTDLEHYQSRLKLVLGREGYGTALELLTEAAVSGGVLWRDAIDRRQTDSQAWAEADAVPVDDVLHLLEHDGYLARQGDDYRFVSGLLEDWWRTRYGRRGASASARGAGSKRKKAS